MFTIMVLFVEPHFLLQTRGLTYLTKNTELLLGFSDLEEVLRKWS